MPFTIDEAYLPATLTASPMTDDEFSSFCAEHPDLAFEMTAEGEILVMPPAYSVTGFRNGEITRQLANWSCQDDRGTTGDSSTGFVLPNGARRSPDASWTEWARIWALPENRRRKYLHLCPEFVIELMSDTDRVRVAQAKMREWIDNGAQLGWLIDPESKTVEVYRPGHEPELLQEPRSVAGEGPVAGFVLDLTRIWALRTK